MHIHLRTKIRIILKAFVTINLESNASNGVNNVAYKSQFVSWQATSFYCISGVNYFILLINYILDFNFDI